MDYQEIEKQIEYYEDRIIINFDKYFSELIMMDFYEGGFDDRLSDELYFEEYYEKYENGIINLMFEIEAEEKYYEFRLRLIKLKRIIDNKLHNLNNEEENNVIKIKPIRQLRISYFKLLTKVNMDLFINKLHSQLQLHNFIQCEISDFKMLFLKEGIKNKIQWKGTELQITSLINELMKYFDPEVDNYKFKVIVNHFINKSTKVFNSKQLASVYADKKEFLPNNDPIRFILKEMSTHF